jgi:hypothetical protein
MKLRESKYMFNFNKFQGDFCSFIALPKKKKKKIDIYVHGNHVINMSSICKISFIVHVYSRIGSYFLA